MTNPNPLPALPPQHGYIHDGLPNGELGFKHGPFPKDALIACSSRPVYTDADMRAYAESAIAALGSSMPSGEARAEEDAAVIDRLAKLLAGVAIALKGDELPLHRHSYHDLPELAGMVKLELDLYRAQAAPATQPTAAKSMPCEDCNGTGEVGDEIYQGEFQPPERERCDSCNGSGRWSQDAAVQGGLTVSDAMIDAYLKAQRETVEEADRFGRPNAGGLHTNTVREACRAGIRAALSANAGSQHEALEKIEAIIVGGDPGMLNQARDIARDALAGSQQCEPNFCGRCGSAWHRQHMCPVMRDGHFEALASKELAADHAHEWEYVGKLGDYVCACGAIKGDLISSPPSMRSALAEACDMLEVWINQYPSISSRQKLAHFRAALSANAGSQQGEPVTSYEVAELVKERDGWREKAKWSDHALHLAQCDNTLLRAQAGKDVWVWQGDGTDHLASMGNRMVVVIFAKDLRAALATPKEAGSQPADLFADKRPLHEQLAEVRRRESPSAELLNTVISQPTAAGAAWKITAPNSGYIWFTEDPAEVERFRLPGQGHKIEPYAALAAPADGKGAAS